MKKIMIAYVAILIPLMMVSQDVIINEIMSSNTTTIVDCKGETGDWIELYNKGSLSLNLQGYFLSDDDDNPEKWSFPNVEIASGDYLIIWASGKDIVYPNGEIHTNFKIKSSGEELFLTKPDGSTVLDQSPSIALPSDISYGHKPDNYSDWFYFEEATPGKKNSTNGYTDIVQAPAFSHTRGFYASAFALNLTSENSQDIIRYTLDGSEPTMLSPLYSSPINISQTTAVRVKVFRDGAISSAVFTHTYLFENDLHLDVVSLVTTSENLWGSEGIYTNYNSGKEKPVHVEFLKHSGDQGFNLDAGIKIHAPDSKPQKSFRLYARGKYGTKKIEYRVFNEKEITSFRRLVLRNGGNDGAKYKKTHIRDAFIHEIYQQLNPENAVAAYLPVNVFINGSYFGIYNLRERQDKYYMKDNFGYDEDEIDFLEYDWAEPGHKKTITGDWNDFNRLKSYVISENMADEASFQMMEDWMDMDNFIDYQIIEIFIGNQDWFNNNIKFWRPRSQEGKWKWVLWDTEYGLGTYRDWPVGHPEFNFMHMAMTYGGWGNDDYTWLLRNLMDNQGFKQKFVTRMLDLLNSLLVSDYTISQFDPFAEKIAPDMQKQFDKWGSNMSLWENDLQYTRDFLTQRPEYFIENTAKELGYSSAVCNLTVDVLGLSKGIVKVNTIDLDQSTPGMGNMPYPWTGKYLKDIPVKLKAIPEPGKVFLHWEGASNSKNSEIMLSLTGDTEITAVFENLISVEDHTSDVMEIKLYPVPVSQNLTVEVSNPERKGLTLRIFNVSGQSVFTKEINGQENVKFSLNISSFKAGVYVLRTIVDNGNVMVKKFIVQH
jgi:hypothetical protein